ncbi:MAG: DUF3253 domain-containing protein [Acetobacteraceae bacterium]|nr:DUF3253 domain-containing protein [Acetobacteraceae bacterium]
MTDARQIEAEIIAQTRARGPSASICPSEVAPTLADEWRPLMHAVREAAVRLAQAGRIEILRKGKPIDPAAIHGVVRLRAAAEATP